MRRILPTLVLVVLILALPACAADLGKLVLPEGFGISYFARGVKGARLMAVSPEGVLYVTQTREGRVAALPDANGDGRADRVVTVAEDLNNPHGIAFHKGYVYIAETGRVVRFKRKGLMLTGRETVVPWLPTKGGGHFTRTLAFDRNGQMFVSVGSSCNICIENERERASILTYTDEGKDKAFYAEGLRNAVGLAFHPVTGQLYATDNGRDWLGDNQPPDELNLIELGGHYGWPYCWGDRHPDKEYGQDRFCKTTAPPVVKFQAHSAPLGLAFTASKAFPRKYQGGLFVAFHGSWNRTVPTGDKVVFVPFHNNHPIGLYVDFITGWLRDGKKTGRPVDIAFGHDRAMYISDDQGGAIYRVVYRPGKPAGKSR
jgi:glucose/arabinose dehydrogenase